MEKVSVFAPATVANVGPAFDVLGFAVDSPGDIVRARRTTEQGVFIRKISGDNGALSREPEKNTASIAAANAMKRLRVTGEGIDLEIEKGLPLNSGLGSSGASAVCGAFAAMKLFGNGEPKEDFVVDCMDAEGAVSGFHADNVAPSMLGGFVLVRSYNPLEVIRLGCPESLYTALVSPELQVPTKMAREILPKSILIRDMVKNYGNIASMVSGICRNDIRLIGKSVEDCVVEPVRARLIPGFGAVKKAAMDAGALGCSISGSGPTVFAFSDSSGNGKSIGKAMQDAFSANGLKSIARISRVNPEGAKVV